MAARWWVRRILWIDGLGALAAGIVVLGFRRFFAGLYEFPIELITLIGLVNLAYAAFALTLAAANRRGLAWIVGLSIANCSWAVVCVLLAIGFDGNANFLGQGHLFIEAAWVAMLGTIEWRNRRELAGVR